MTPHLCGFVWLFDDGSWCLSIRAADGFEYIPDEGFPGFHRGDQAVWLDGEWTSDHESSDTWGRVEGATMADRVRAGFAALAEATDAAALREALEIVGSIPAPAGQGWGPSATASGYIGHSTDTCHALTLLSRLRLAAADAQHPDHDPQHDDTPAGVLAELRAWYERRVADDWTMEGARRAAHG